MGISFISVTTGLYMVFVLKFKPVAGRVISSFVRPEERLFVQILVENWMYRTSNSQTTGAFPSWTDEITFAFPMVKRIKVQVCTDAYIIGEGELLTERAFDTHQFEDVIPLINGQHTSAGELRITVELMQVAANSPVSRPLPRSPVELNPSHTQSLQTGHFPAPQPAAMSYPALGRK